MGGCVAVLNAGSSSIKFASYDADDGPRARCSAARSSDRRRRFAMLVNDAGRDRDGARPGRAERSITGSRSKKCCASDRGWRRTRAIRAVGHRVVHGGTTFAAADAGRRAAMEALEKLVPLAPLHQPHNLAAIRIIADAAPELPQVACFDTAFHRSQPALAQSFALPRRAVRRGRAALRLPRPLLRIHRRPACRNSIRPWSRGRVIVAHLGNGASLCAVQAGRSVASTMGFTAVDGLMMGTRCGALDPGVHPLSDGRARHGARRRSRS